MMVDQRDLLRGPSRITLIKRLIKPFETLHFSSVVLIVRVQLLLTEPSRIIIPKLEMAQVCHTDTLLPSSSHFVNNCLLR